MGSHNVGESPFMKRVLVPFWCIRIFIMVIDVAVYGLAIGVLAAFSADSETKAKLDSSFGSMSVGTLIGLLVVIMLIILLCLILDIVCIIKRARRTLTPRFFLIVNVIQTTIWIIMFILSMIGYKSGAAVAVSVIVLLSFIGLLIYAAVIFHKQRKGTLSSKTPVEGHSLVVQNNHYQSYDNATYPPPPVPQNHTYYDPQANYAKPGNAPQQHYGA